jgi:hypothetical protein
MAKAKPIVGIDPQAPLIVNAALILGTRLGEMLAYESALSDPDRVYELHQMRIAAKRLRYTMEMFQDAYEAFSRFGKPFAAATDEIKQLQEHLGELHDADVLAPQLTEHLARLLKPGYGTDKRGEPVVGVHHVDFDACQGLLTLCQEIRTQRDARYRQLLEHWEQLQAQDYFGKLRALLRDALEEASLYTTAAHARAVLTSPAEAGPTPCAVTPKDKSANGKNNLVKAGDGEQTPPQKA